MKRLLIILTLALCLAGCGIYSFTGTSIDPDVHTICIPTFEYKAMRVNPSLANDLSEEIRNRFRRMTRLEQVEMDGDLEIIGEISGYDVQASAVTADEVAAQNRLTVSVRAAERVSRHMPTTIPPIRSTQWKAPCAPRSSTRLWKIYSTQP